MNVETAREYSLSKKAATEDIRKQIHAGRGKDDIFLPAVVSPQGTLRGIRYRGEKSHQHLEDEEKMNIIANLTAKQKAVIRRDFLIDNFKGAYGNNATATLLLDFARKHMPDTLAEIESGYNEVYEKRHKRIEERKAALLAKERQTKPEETAEAENTQPTAEVQPEEHTQTEEVAA